MSAKEQAPGETREITSPDYKSFIERYLNRGAVGISVGLAVIAAAASAKASVPSDEKEIHKSFAARLAQVRSAVSRLLAQASPSPSTSPTVGANAVGPIPFMNTPPKPFNDVWHNWGNAPFSDSWKNWPKATDPKKPKTSVPAKPHSTPAPSPNK